MQLESSHQASVLDFRFCGNFKNWKIFSEKCFPVLNVFFFKNGLHVTQHLSMNMSKKNQVGVMKNDWGLPFWMLKMPLFMLLSGFWHFADCQMSDFGLSKCFSVIFALLSKTSLKCVPHHPKPEILHLNPLVRFSSVHVYLAIPNKLQAIPAHRQKKNS